MCSQDHADMRFNVGEREPEQHRRQITVIIDSLEQDDVFAGRQPRETAQRPVFSSVSVKHRWR